MNLTPELASRMLSVYERRLVCGRRERFTTSLLEAALLPTRRAPPPAAYMGPRLKRPTWRHDKGSRS